MTGWLAGGLVIAAGAAIPVELAVAPAGSGHDTVRVVEPTPAPDRPAHDRGEPPHATATAAAPGGGSARETATRAPAAVASPTGYAGPVAGSSTAGATTAGYPWAASCSLNSVGLAPGRTRRCQFTATAAGGWAYRSDGGAGFDIPQATLTVTHAGRTTIHRSTSDAACADAVIVRGDRVQLTLTAPVTDVEPVYSTGAGQGWDCTHQG